MRKVNIVGVPEHFNTPWQLSIENGDFARHNIDLQWKDIAQGTGLMCSLLRQEKADLAVILTEGIIKDIAHGNNSTIIQQYVSSPLIWGIHVKSGSPLQTIDALQNKRVAISRFGSGSHLMAIVHARTQNWDVNTLEFVVVDTLEGAIIALQNDLADYFMWEKFMTQPVVDQNIFARIGEFPTPWPSFVIVANNTFLQNNSEVVQTILNVINTATQEFKDIPSIDRTLASLFDQQIKDIQKWLKITKWSDQKLSKKDFDNVNTALCAVELIDTPINYKLAVRD